MFESVEMERAKLNNSNLRIFLVKMFWENPKKHFPITFVLLKLCFPFGCQGGKKEKIFLVVPAEIRVSGRRSHEGSGLITLGAAEASNKNNLPLPDERLNRN